MTDRTHPDSGRIITSSDVIADLQARIAELEAELEAVGAGGVQALSAAPAEQNESAYQRGYLDGMAKGRRDAEAAPQQEAQEPVLCKRKAFESWARRQPWIKDCGKAPDGDAYGHWDTQKAWLAWNAALAAPQQEAQEPVAFRCLHEWDGLARTSMPPKYACKHCHNFFDAPPSPALQPAPAQLSEREAFEVAWEKLHVLEEVANRLSIDLECMTLDPTNAHWHDTANESLQRYRDLMDAWYPQDHVSPLGKD